MAELVKQKYILMTVFGVVSSSIIVLIFCIFYLIVQLKRKDVAIMKSCGATCGAVAFIFMGFGMCVGLVGSGLGVILGYVITKNINTIEESIRILFGWKLWDSSIYMFTKIPNQIDWLSTLIIFCFAVAASVLGALLPAIVAARVKPVNILRYE